MIIKSGMPIAWSRSSLIGLSRKLWFDRVEEIAHMDKDVLFCVNDNIDYSDSLSGKESINCQFGLIYPAFFII